MSKFITSHLDMLKLSSYEALKFVRNFFQCLFLVPLDSHANLKLYEE